MLRFARRRLRPLPRFGCGTARYPLLRRRRLLAAGDAGSARSLAAARVGLGPLPPDRKPAPVANPAVGADLGQALDVLRALAPQITLNLVRLDGLAQLHRLLVGQVLDVGVGIDADLVQDPVGGRAADAMDVGE